MNPIAWMGGSRPRPLLELSRGERRYVTRLFREQVDTWLDYWGDSIPMDVCRTFWKRARYDAHATYRNEGE
jgi:hypothetical protein